MKLASRKRSRTLCSRDSVQASAWLQWMCQPNPWMPASKRSWNRRLTRVEFDGIRYSLVGASGSAKKGKFYAVESRYEKRLAERFRFSPQAAMTYFGILVSSCKVMIEVPDCRLLVVDDRELGTNDCRGWISQYVVHETPGKTPRRIFWPMKCRRLLANRSNSIRWHGQHSQRIRTNEEALKEQAEVKD